MIRAIIFDLDGTLVDTEPIHLAAFSAVLKPEGIAVSREDYFRRLIGCSDRECLALLLSEHGRDSDPAVIQRLIARKSAAYLSMMAGRDLLYPGAAEFVRACAARFPLILATGTLRHEAELILRGADMRELFADIVAAEDVERGKPEPDAFLAALGRLGFIFRQRDAISNDQCLAIEDTAAGVEAAHRAGMRVLAIAHTSDVSALAGADLVRASLAETDLDDVLRSIAR